MTDAEAIGRFQSMTEAEMFDIEYWSLEQAKLGGAVEKPLAGQVALVTGGGRHDRRRDGARACAAPAPRSRCSTAPAPRSRMPRKSWAALGIAADVTDPAAVRAAFDRVARALRRRRYRRLECRRRLAGPDRRGRRIRSCAKLRVEFLRAPDGGAERGAHHAGAGHRRLPVVQRVAAGGQPGRRFRPLRLPKAATLS